MADAIPDGHKRFVIVFNAKHTKAIEKEVARRDRERGYTTSASDALRDLVETHWCPK